MDHEQYTTTCSRYLHQINTRAHPSPHQEGQKPDHERGMGIRIWRILHPSNPLIPPNHGASFRTSRISKCDREIAISPTAVMEMSSR
ncbi:hypothetical protein AAFF_G00130290 [Aldrovandia affinis]|uniref:Uncharacterized protein n=1 Tax=Aldrovandia affinis TaxID=143900 RepID=A0AAD7W9E6_9TELE|nr:hypothetical protein AAFF_G00130290 [Aldrovandia affinis]